MDALIPTFIAVLLAETGDRTQYHTHRLGMVFADHRPVYAALIIAAMINLGFGALGGALIATMLTFEARTLFAGLALIFAGLPMLMALRHSKPIIAKRPFLTSLFWLMPAQIAGASPFLIAGLAARTGMPILSFAGGLAAMLVAAAAAARRMARRNTDWRDAPRGCRLADRGRAMVHNQRAPFDLKNQSQFRI